MTASIVGTPEQSNSGSGNVVADMPSGIVSGELLIIHIAYDTGTVITTPTGWTELDQDDDGVIGFYTGYRTADGTEPSSYTFTSSDSDGWVCYVFRVEDHDGIDIDSTVSSGDSDEPIAPSVTTTEGDCLVISFASVDTAASEPFTPPSGTTELYDAGLRGVGITAAYFTQATAGATGTRTFTADVPRDWMTHTVAIAPSSGGTQYNQSAAGTLSFGGAVDKKTGKPLSGILSFSGATSQQIAKSLPGTLSFTGVIVKQADKSLSGTFGFVGTLTSIKTALKSLTGTLSFSGNVSREIGVVKTGVLSFTGNVIKRPAKLLAGSLSLTGTLVSVKIVLLLLVGDLDFSGTLSRQTRTLKSGTLTMTGVLSRLTSKSLTGILTFIGTLATLVGGALTPTRTFVLKAYNYSALKLKATVSNFKLKG